MSSLFSFIKQQVPIVQEVSRYVRLRPAGSYYKGPCPFHKETDASFTVSPDKGIFYCFGCHATGDIVSFIAKAENLSPIDAAKQLIETHGLQIPEELLRVTSGSGKTTEAKSSYFSVHKCVAQWAHEQLRLSPHAYEYVRSRGFTEQMIDAFMIGFFPSGPKSVNALLASCMKENILAKDLVDAGIFYEATGSKTQLRSPFEDRIIFPITDSMNRFCGFGGRIFIANDDRAKYYNSKESPFFIKGTLLFGYSAAKKSMQERKAVFLVEGYTDAVMMAQYGYTNVVATLGTACTKEHLKMLSRLVDVVYVLYDGDAAGRKAMLRLAQLCWDVHLELQVITLPHSLDPAAYLAKYGSLAEVMAQSLDIFSFFVSATADEFIKKSLAEKMRIIEEVLEVVSKIADVVKRELLLQQLATAVNIPLTALRLKLQEQVKAMSSVDTYPLIESTKADVEDAPQDTLEAHLVAISFNSCLQQYVHVLPDDVVAMLSSRAQSVYRVIIHEHEVGSDGDFVAAVLDRLSDEQKNWLIAHATTYSGVVSEQEFAALASKLVQQRWKEMVGQIKQDIAQASQQGNKEKVEELLSTFAQWKEQMQQKGHMLWQKK